MPGGGPPQPPAQCPLLPGDPVAGGARQVSCDWWRAGHVTTLLPSDWLAGPGAGSSRTRACSWADAWPAPTPASSPGRKCYLALLRNMIRDVTKEIVCALHTAQC